MYARSLDERKKEIVFQDAAESILSFLSSLPTFKVHTKLDKNNWRLLYSTSFELNDAQLKGWIISIVYQNLGLKPDGGSVLVYRFTRTDTKEPTMFNS